MRLHHIQLAIPVGSEDAARAFWVGILGFAEVVKPAPLAARGGLWLRRGEVDVHLGVEARFTPAQKAHPGFLVDDLDQVRSSLESAGFATRSDDLFPGHLRFYADDPFGNRLEFLQDAN